MADDNDTPTDTQGSPKPTRRRVTRTTSAADAAKPAPRRGRKPAAEKDAGAVAGETAAAPKRTAAAKAPAKPRSTKRAAPRATARRKAPEPSRLDKATEKVGGKWGAAAIAGGLAAAGAAAALFTLRGSTSRSTQPEPGNRRAHQPDGTDSSASFEAGIADESTIPDKM